MPTPTRFPAARALGGAGAESILGRTPALEAAKANRTAAQQQKLQFLQETVARQLDIDKNRFELNALRAGDDIAYTPDDAIQASDLKQARDGARRAIHFRSTTGSRIGIVDTMKNPEVAALVEFFTKTRGVAMIKELLQDERLSEDDRCAYEEIQRVGLVEWFTSGQQGAIAKLKILEGAIANRQMILAEEKTGLVQKYPQFFTVLDFDAPSGSELVQGGRPNRGIPNIPNLGAF